MTTGVPAQARSHTRVPALDGIRGLAILLVIAGHTFTTVYAPASHAGVAVFFTLSGYLITSLLLAERNRTGHINLGAFYLRRARRLLPALFVLLALTLTLGATVWVGFGTPAGAWPALLYVANYNYLYDFGDLGGLLAPQTGFGHLWSLSIEEQFYLLFPAGLLLTRRLSQRHLLRAFTTLTVAAIALRVALLAAGANEERIYYGTDSTACLLLIGCTLAVWHREGSRLPTWVSTLALAALLPLGFWTRAGEASLLPIVAALLTAAAIAAAPSSGWLVCGPLRLVGRRSYALYLWHLPALHVWYNLGGPVAWLLCVSAAWGVTLLSWRYVEEPFLRRRTPHLERTPAPATAA